jgi:hypothetical protein
MKKIVSIAILLLVITGMFGAVLTTAALADENYNDWSQELGDENNPWKPIFDDEGNLIGWEEYPSEAAEDMDARAEDRTRNKDN